MATQCRAEFIGNEKIDRTIQANLKDVLRVFLFLEANAVPGHQETTGFLLACRVGVKNPESVVAHTCIDSRDLQKAKENSLAGELNGWRITIRLIALCHFFPHADVARRFERKNGDRNETEYEEDSEWRCKKIHRARRYHTFMRFPKEAISLQVTYALAPDEVDEAFE